MSDCQGIFFEGTDDYSAMTPARRSALRWTTAALLASVWATAARRRRMVRMFAFSERHLVLRLKWISVKPFSRRDWVNAAISAFAACNCRSSVLRDKGMTGALSRVLDYKFRSGLQTIGFYGQRKQNSAHQNTRFYRCPPCLQPCLTSSQPHLRPNCQLDPPIPPPFPLVFWGSEPAPNVRTRFHAKRYNGNYTFSFGFGILSLHPAAIWQVPIAKICGDSPRSGFRRIPKCSTDSFAS